jgi:hypothetical protein
LPLVFAELLGHGRSEELLDPPAPPQGDQQIQQLREAARRKRAGVMAAMEALAVLLEAAAIPLLRLKNAPLGCGAFADFKGARDFG